MEFAPVAQLDRAVAFEAIGRRFESFRERYSFLLEGAVAPSLQPAKLDWSLPSPRSARGAPTPLAFRSAAFLSSIPRLHVGLLAHLLF